MYIPLNYDKPLTDVLLYFFAITAKFLLMNALFSSLEQKRERKSPNLV